MPPILSPAQMRLFTEANAGPVSRIVDILADDPEKLAEFRTAFGQLVAEYFDDNVLRQDFMMSRAVKI